MPIQQPNLVARYAQGVQTGNALQQLRDQRADRARQDQARNALGDLVSGNAQPNSLAQLAQADPKTAMQFQQAQSEQQAAQQETEAKQAAQAALTVKNALETGNLPLAAQTIQQMPDSPRKQQALQSLAQGDADTVAQMADGIIEGATRMGVLEPGPSPVSLGEGSRLVDPSTGRQIAQGAPREQRPVSLSEGSRLVDPETGEEIAQGGPRRPPTGRYRSEVDDFGNLSVIDTMTGEVVRRERPQLPEQSPQAPAGQGDVFGAVEQGTGPVASIRAGVNNVIGPFIQGVPFEGTNRSRAAIRNFNQEAKTALVNNPRFPVAEQEVVQRMLPNPERFFQDPDAARQELQELRSFLTNKRQQNLQSMQGGRVTSEEYGDLSNQVAAIDRVLGLMGTPEGQSGNVIDFNDLPE